MHERYLFDIATQPAILGRVADLLGDDVVLWGVSAVRRKPGDVHPWHSDIESSAQTGGFVSVWIGLEHTSRDSSLQLICASHRSGTSVQEARAAHGIARDDATPQSLLQLVRSWAPDAELVEPEMTDGDGIFFDGRLWHGTDNRSRSGERLALVLQFAGGGAPSAHPGLERARLAVSPPRRAAAARDPRTRVGSQRLEPSCAASATSSR